MYLRPPATCLHVAFTLEVPGGAKSAGRSTASLCGEKSPPFFPLLTLICGPYYP